MAQELIDTLPSAAEARDRVKRLIGYCQVHEADLDRKSERLKQVRSFLELAPQVEVALETLSSQLFGQIVGLLEEKLSIALEEVLEQPIKLRASADYKRSSASVEFYIERNGQHEDILRGQGGSVTNVLSVGLRMFALTQLDPEQHRRFLVLDEQDCWLRPDLVPRLVRIIHDAGEALGYQTILISHHDVSAFTRWADKIYRFVPQADQTVQIELEARTEVRDSD